VCCCLPGERSLRTVDAVKLSREARIRLEQELGRLENELLPAARRGVEEARTQGDMSQNPDFFIAAEAEGRLLLRRSAVVEALEADATSVPVALDAGVVAPGCVVTLDFGDGPEEYLIGSIEEQYGDMLVITPESPIGRELIGRCAGAEVASPSGSRVRLAAIRFDS